MLGGKDRPPFLVHSIQTFGSTVSKIRNFMAGGKQSCIHCISQYFNNGEMNYVAVALTMNRLNANETTVYQENTYTDFFECTICRLIIENLRIILNGQHSRASITEALHSVCSVIGPFRDFCEKVVMQHFDTIADLLINVGVNDKICGLARLCSIQEIDTFEDNQSANDEAVFLLNQYSPDIEGVECPVCRLIIKGVRSTLKGQRSRAAVENALHKVCSKLGRKVGHRCNNIISKHFNKLADLIVRYGANGKICKMIMLCSIHGADSSSGEFSHVISFSRLEGNNDFAKDDAVFLPNQYSPDIEGVECPVCRLIIKGVRSTLKGQRSRAAVENALHKVCSKLGRKVGHRCNNIISKHFNKLADLIVRYGANGKICKMIMLCSIHGADSSSGEFSHVISFSQIEGNNDFDDYLSENLEDSFENTSYELMEYSERAEIEKKGGQCTVCKLVVSGLKKLIQNDHSKAKIQEALSKVCGKLRKLGSKCQHFVAEYSNQLVDLLMHGADKKKICRTLKLCSIQEEQIRNGLKMSTESNTVEFNMCNSCKLGLNLMKTLVDHPNIVKFIHDRLNNICDLVPSIIGPMCHNEVATHWIQIINFLRHINEIETCHTVWMCNNMVKVCTEIQLGSSKCDSCLATGTLIKYLFKMPEFQKRLYNNAISMCYRLEPHQNLVVICQQEIQSKWSDWMASFQKVSVNKVCLQMKECP